MKPKIRYYKQPEAVGYLGWVETDSYVVFIGLDGSFSQQFKKEN